MFGKAITLFKVFGFAVRMDASWLVIAVLVAWSLAAGLFPEIHPGLSPAAYWTMGLVGALGLFASIVVHELCHSLVARRFGLPIKGITLFIFGGVAEMADEPPSPKAEFFIAVGGPAASVVIAGVCYGVHALALLAGWPTAVTGVLGWLGLINLVLVAFNMIPGYPMDGGRVLRSALWHWKKNIRWATKIASKVGVAFGMVLIGLGVVSFIFGNIIGGLWWFLIGMFIRSAAMRSYEQLVVRQTLGHETVGHIMNDNPVAVAPDTSVQQLVDDYMLRYHYKTFPVVDHGDLVGCVSVPEVKQLPREQWSQHQVAEIIQPCSNENTVGADDEATEAMDKFAKGQTSRLMVVREGHLVGILALRDLMKFLAMKNELEGDGPAKAA